MYLSLSVIGSMIGKSYSALQIYCTRNNIKHVSHSGHLKLYDVRKFLNDYDLEIETGKVLVTVNQKGGVGKTTITVNTALALRNYGLKVLIIDFDQQGNVTDLLRMDTKPDFPSWYDVAINKKPLKDVILQSPYENLDVIPTDDRNMPYLSMEWQPQYQRRNWENHFNELLKEYDYILCDMPAQYDASLITVLQSCNELIIPVYLEQLSMLSMTRYFDKLNEINNDFNLSYKISLIPNRVNLTTSEHRSNLTLIEKQLNKFLIHNFENETVYVNQYQEFHKELTNEFSVWEHSKKSKMRDSILMIAKSILGLEVK